MYEAYWELQARPFEAFTDPRFYYPSEVHQGALLKLRYAIENRRGAALLVGASGTGKTMLMQMLRRQLGESRTPFVHLVFPQLTREELLAYLALEMGAIAPTEATPSAIDSVRAISRFLQQNTARERHAVVAIDESQLLLDTDHFETLRLLLNFEAVAPPLTLLIVGQPSLLPALERNPTLEERLVVKCLLRPFTSDETGAYVSHRLRAAGAQRDIFTGDALSALYRSSLGCPRKIDRLCDLALLVAFAEEQPQITASQIEAVANELIEVGPE